jgi:hypothetical protein
LTVIITKSMSYYLTYLTLIRICKRLGMDVRWLGDQTGNVSSYEKNTIFVSVRMVDVMYKPRKAQETLITLISHELAHWMVSSAGSRERRDYGLKRGKSYSLSESKALLAQRTIYEHLKLSKKLRDQIDMVIKHTPESIRSKAQKWWDEVGNMDVKNLLTKALLV